LFPEACINLSLFQIVLVCFWHYLQSFLWQISDVRLLNLLSDKLLFLEACINLSLFHIVVVCLWHILVFVPLTISPLPPISLPCHSLHPHGPPASVVHLFLQFYPVSTIHLSSSALAGSLLPKPHLETWFCVTVGLTDSYGAGAPLMESMIFRFLTSLTGTFLYISLSNKQTSSKLTSNNSLIQWLQITGCVGL
jgi:hypothetical protein